MRIGLIFSKWLLSVSSSPARCARLTDFATDVGAVTRLAKNWYVCLSFSSCSCHQQIFHHSFVWIRVMYDCMVHSNSYDAAQAVSIYPGPCHDLYLYIYVNERFVCCQSLKLSFNFSSHLSDSLKARALLAHGA